MRSIHKGSTNSASPFSETPEDRLSGLDWTRAADIMRNPRHGKFSGRSAHFDSRSYLQSTKYKQQGLMNHEFHGRHDRPRLGIVIVIQERRCGVSFHPESWPE